MAKKNRKQRGDNMQDMEQKPLEEEQAQMQDDQQPADEAEQTQEPVEENEQIEVTAEALKAALDKQEEYVQMAQRVQADFENYRRRNQNVRKEAFDEGARAFITTLLPVLDNLERAIAAAADSSDASLREGVEMVYRQFCDVFEKRGITVIDRLGEVFDPNLENAVMQGSPDEGEPGTVCAVLQKGYQLEGVVIRHAMVKVVPD